MKISILKYFESKSLTDQFKLEMFLKALYTKYLIKLKWMFYGYL